MSESLLLISPASTNKGMGPEEGMRISSRDAAASVGKLVSKEVPSQKKSSRLSSFDATQTSKHKNAFRTVIDKDKLNDESSKKEREPTKSGNCDAMQERDVVFSNGKSKKKTGSLVRSGPILEIEDQDSSGPSSEVKYSLPQHERIQAVEPLDISYLATPASIRLKELLMSRLEVAAPKGRIQVVSTRLRGV